MVMASAHIIMFVSLQTYYDMAELFGGHDGLQWFFAVMCVIALIFIYFFLPETHGKTLLEIENYFNSHTVYSTKEIRNSKSGEKGLLWKSKKMNVMESLKEKPGEYETLVKGKENKCPKIVIEDPNMIGETDVRKLDYIDKSVVELDRIPYA